jgi:hypothetical protein
VVLEPNMPPVVAGCDVADPNAPPPVGCPNRPPDPVLDCPAVLEPKPGPVLVPPPPKPKPPLGVLLVPPPN